MKTTKEIAERLSEPIPLPRTNPPKKQGSWATLKVGDRLLQTRSDSVSGLAIQLEHEVTLVSSVGATLVADDGNVVVTLTDRDWKEHGWQRMPRREKSRSGR